MILPLLLFIVILFLFVLSIRLVIYESDDYIFLSMFSGGALLVLVLITALININAKGTIASEQAQVETLQAQYNYLIEIQENSEFLLYEGLQEVYIDTFINIREANAKIKRCQALSDSIWVGLWYPKQWNNVDIVKMESD